MRRVHATVGRIAETETADVLRRQGITVLEGRARIRSEHRVDVDACCTKSSNWGPGGRESRVYCGFDWD